MTDVVSDVSRYQNDIDVLLTRQLHHHIQGNTNPRLQKNAGIPKSSRKANAASIMKLAAISSVPIQFWYAVMARRIHRITMTVVGNWVIVFWLWGRSSWFVVNVMWDMAMEEGIALCSYVLGRRWWCQRTLVTSFSTNVVQLWGQWNMAWMCRVIERKRLE